MKVVFTESFLQQVTTATKKNGLLCKRFEKQFTLFSQNPRHPSLHLHKLQGKRSEQFSFRIEGDLRAVAIRKDDTYIFFELVTHDQY